MEGNLLLEQFSRYKKLELEASPFHFLLDANIELNPHQINAFCAAIQALKTGGIVLADEVGLGKTIEAGLVLKYVLESGAKRVLIALPASLRKQWELELEDKFGLESVILDRLTVEKDSSDWRKRLTDNKSVRIVLTSYDYSSKLMKRFPEVKWDFIIIDEAHNLRNVFHGTKRAKNLKEDNKSFKYTTVLYRCENREYFKTIKDGAGDDIVIERVLDYETKSVKQVAQLEGITEEEVYEKYYDQIMTTTNAQTSIRTRVWDATDSENNMYIATYTPKTGKDKDFCEI